MSRSRATAAAGAAGRAEVAVLAIVTTETLAPGFQLAGARTFVAETAAEALPILERLVEADDVGVIGVHTALLDPLPQATRSRLESRLLPIVVALPAGARGADPQARRARLTRMLRDAVGYHIRFREGGAT